MKQIEVDVIDEHLPIDIYEILYYIAPQGFIERTDGAHRFVLFVEDNDIDIVSNKLREYQWVADVKVGSSVEEDGWLKSWRDNYKPIKIPPFKIIPAWLKDTEPTDGLLPIYINSGIAFGTGEHETTQLCLRLLSQIDVKGKTVLDIGTGSGILAIAASLLGAREVYAFDLDPVAVEVARENVAINDIDNIKVFQKDALQYKGKGYDVVMANLVWSILSEISKPMRETVGAGLFIASGILKEQLHDFLRMYEKEGFHYITHEEIGEWVGVLMSG